MEKSQSTSKTEPDIRGLNNLVTSKIRSSIRSPVCSPVLNMLMYQKTVEQMEILIFNQIAN